MKQFNVKDFISNEETPVVTRNGKSVRIICTDRKDEGFHIIALINVSANYEEVISYTEEGKIWVEKEDSANDLFFAPKKRKGWVNVYKLGNNYYSTSDVVWSKEEAKSMIDNDSDYVITIPIEWEE